MGMDSYYDPIGTPETNASILKLWDSLTNNSKGEYKMIEVA